MPESSSTPDWNRLLDMAEAEVSRIIQALPDQLREVVEKLPVIYEKHPHNSLLSDGIDSETLGLFLGSTYADGVDSGALIPAQIILYLDNIWAQADGDLENYRLEVRTTLLHELGHYLGLGEEGLAERGLE